jgi:asparagine synthase (glutamine-hydrolysing)
MAIDLSVYLPGLGLAYVDRAGMEYGVEIRVPWLDLEFVRWTMSLPDAILMQRGRGKRLPRDLAAKLLSHSVAHRPKRGFAAPARSINRTGLREGARGFRQGTYFARASAMVAAFMDRGGLSA